MFEKLKILSLMQLSEKMKFKRDATANQKLGVVGKLVAAMGIAYGIFTLLFFLIFKVLFFSASVNLFIFVLFLMQIISIISNTVTMSSTLYTSKDNQLLMTYPVKHLHVYISKVVVSYIIELRKSLIFTFPIFMAYATIVTNVLTPNFVISGIFYSVILPIFPVLIGAILSIPLMYFKKLLNSQTIIKGLLTLALFIGLLFLTYFLVSLLPDNLRIVALYNSFLTKLDAFLENVNSFAGYTLFIGRAMYGIDPWLNDLIAIGILIGVAVVSILISLPLFYKLASSATENSVQKVHNSKNTYHSSTFLTFMRKELILSIRNASDFISDYFFLFIMPFVLVLMASIYLRIDTNPLGDAMTYGFIGLIALIMLSASNTSSATAISSEGTEFVLLKTSPGKSRNIVWAKLLINYIISLTMTTISWIFLSIVTKSRVDMFQLWIVYIFIVIIEFGLILWSIQLDILHPKLKEYANSQNRSDVKNFSSSILIGLVVSLILSIIMIVIFLMNLPVWIILVLLLALALIFVGIRLYLLINYIYAFFNDIEL